MRLYSYWRLSASWRVRIALAWKGIPYETVPVNLAPTTGEQLADAFRAKNPMAQVPTLEWEEDGVTRRLTQSVAICEYLDAREASAGPRLVPADPWLAALVRERVEMVNAGMQPLHNLSVSKRVAELAPGTSAEAWNGPWIHAGLRALEAQARQSAGDYLVGDTVTLADVFLVPQLYSARRFGVDVAPFPTLLRVEARCEALAAFRAAHAHHQPDAPKEVR